MTHAACLLSDVMAMVEGPGKGGGAFASALPRVRLPFMVPEALTPGLAGLIVGALSGVVLFGLVLVVAAVRARARTTRGADEAGAFPAVRPRAWGWSVEGGREVEVVRVAPYATGSQHAIPAALVACDPLARAGEMPVACVAAPPAPSSSGVSLRGARGSGVHPLAVIPGDSSAMRVIGRSSVDALVDDSPTEISETLFDELPRPLRRGSPPRIRPIAPAAPRTSEAAAR